MAPSDLQRALESIGDARAATADRVASVAVVRLALATGGIAASAARDAISALHADINKNLQPEYAGRDKEIDGAYSDAMKKYSRELVLSTGARIDGRTSTQIRAISP